MIAKTLMRDVCMEFAVDRDAIVGGSRRRGIITQARAALISRMRAAGFSNRNIARMLKVNPSTVSYHLYEARRLNVQRSARACHERRMAAA